MIKENSLRSQKTCGLLRDHFIHMTLENEKNLAGWTRLIFNAQKSKTMKWYFL
jgi:hypothetical protein